MPAQVPQPPTIVTDSVRIMTDGPRLREVLEVYNVEAPSLSISERSLGRLLAIGFAAKESSDVDDPHDHSVAIDVLCQPPV